MRKLSGKTINSLALCVALAAPLVYLFGTLFMSLAGAHGEQNLAQPVYTQEYVEVHTEGEQANYRLNITSTNYVTDVTATTDIKINFNWNNEDWEAIRLTIQGGLVFGKDTNFTNARLIIGNGGFVVQQPVSLYFENMVIPSVLIRDGSTLYKLIDVPTSTIVESTSAYTDFLFSQFFSYDNFLAESGREVLNGTPLYGFEPIGELVRYTDANMLHLANLSYGPLVIGYTYYCAHVIIVDLIFYIGSFIPRLIKKTINKLEGGLD